MLLQSSHTNDPEWVQFWVSCYEIVLILLFGMITFNVFQSPNCHIYPKEGGGLTNFKKSLFQIVTIGMGREGPRAKLDIVTKYSGFFFEGVP